MASSEPAAPRVPLSLRVPASVLAAIESYAEARGLSKTDSFLHFLQKGMEAEDLSSQLEGIRSELSALRKAVESHFGKPFTGVACRAGCDRAVG